MRPTIRSLIVAATFVAMCCARVPAARADDTTDYIDQLYQDQQAQDDYLQSVQDTNSYIDQIYQDQQALDDYWQSLQGTQDYIDQIYQQQQDLNDYLNSIWQSPK